MTEFTRITAAVLAGFSLSGALQAASHDAAAMGNVCEDGYSVTDVNGDGYVSPIELNAYSERQVVQMDADQSGSVSRDEYINCNMAGRSAGSLDRSTNTVEMSAIDADGNGVISISEFMTAGTESAIAAAEGDSDAETEARALVHVPRGDPDAPLPELSREQAAAGAAKMFVALDTDQSKDLSEAEWLAPIIPQVDISDILTREFDMADADGSGDLTQSELIAANEKRAAAARAAAEENGEEPSPDAPVVYFRYPHVM
ncbi:EF-hand domain-containing protein [Sulfitobacter sabulilitoris]|nr:hypothetical protein [Sulfitobacter sabulilitoris]